MDLPLISIIVPVYKVEQYLSKCIDSILTQTYHNLEIILVDDGSPDRCGSICDGYVLRDSRIFVIHKENAGVGPARNTGLERCNGEYVMFVDSDDFLDPDAIRILYERLVADRSQMAIGKHIDVYEDGTLNVTPCNWIGNELLSSKALMERADGDGNLPVAAWGKLYSRRIFSDVRYPNLRCGEDLWAFMSLVKQCDNISLVDHTVYFYSQRGDSVVHRKTEIVKHDELVATLNTASVLLQDGHKNSAQGWYCRAVARALDFQDHTEAVRLFGQFFDSAQQRRMLAGLGFKTHFRWLALHSKVVNACRCFAKRIIKRG